MLVFGRKVGERVCIGNDVVITVICADRGRLRIGIDAPRDVPVYRGEVIERARAKQCEAGGES